MTPQDDDYTGEKKSMGNDEDVRISMEIQWVCEACISKQIFVTTFMVFYDSLCTFTERIFCFFL